MRIGFDISPLRIGHHLQHKVRGSGIYVENLKTALEKYFPQNSYIFFTQEEKLKDAVDIVHIPFFEPFFLTLPLSKKSKTVVTVHDLTPLVFPQGFPVGIKGKVKWTIQKRLLQAMDRVITDSFASKKDIATIAGIREEKIAVVPLATDSVFKEKKLTEAEENALFKKYSLPKKFVLYVGDGTWNKNLPRLVEATMQADVPLVMVGKALKDKTVNVKNIWNNDLAIIQKFAEANKAIHLLGFVPIEDLVGLYNSASLFAMPSLYEGFGLPILEAMQSGCPVLTTHRGSLIEVAGDGAYIVDPEDISSIAQGIKKIFHDEKLQAELCKKGRKRAQEYSWRKTAELTMDVYKSLQ